MKPAFLLLNLPLEDLSLPKSLGLLRLKKENIFSWMMITSSHKSLSLVTVVLHYLGDILVSPLMLSVVIPTCHSFLPGSLSISLTGR